MRLKHHILLYTFLSVAVLLSIYLALDYGIQAQRSAQALEDAYAQRVLETQEHLQAIGLKLPVEGLKVRFKPSEAQLAEARQFGLNFAAAVLA